MYISAPPKMTTDPVAREFASVEAFRARATGASSLSTGSVSGSTEVSRKAVEAIDELTSVEIVGRLQSVQSIAQNTADDVETRALIAIRLDALGRTFHQ